MTREWDAPSLQKQLGPSPCMLGPAGTASCADVDAIKAKIDAAILEGAKCMQGVDQKLSDDFVKLMILRNQIAPSPTLEVDSLIALRQALGEGLGCAIIARSTTFFIIA